MSYDITLYPRQPGQAWPEVITAAEADDDTLAADEAALGAGVEVFRRIEARLQQVLDGPLEAWVAEETGGDVYGELTAVDTGIEVALFDRSAEVTFNDSDGDDREGLHRQVRRAVGVVAEETGYVAYDPQTRESFDGIIREESEFAPDPQDGATTHGQGSVGPSDGRHNPDGEVAPADTATDEVRPAPPVRNPTSLRRRGWVYLILGLVLILLAGQRLSSDNGGALTIILLIIGILDLLGGLFLLSVAQRAQADETSEGDGTNPA